MKRFLGFTVAMLFFASTTFSVDQSSENEAGEEPSGKVISVHQFNLKPGVDEMEFVHFIMGELAPYYNKVEGQKAVLAKGDRGLRSGQYAFLLMFDSVEDRDRIYPPEGGISEDFEKILEGTDELWDKLGSFLEGDPFGNHTDYVTVGAH